MFIHNINPVLASIGSLEIRYYGLVYAIGFLITYIMFIKVADKHKIKNFTREKADELIIFLMLGGILGARIFDFVFYNPLTFFTNPLEILMVWHGGMSIHGGIIGSMLTAGVFSRKNKISFYKIADLTVIPLAFFLFLGRIANFINAELVGIKTNVNWCVQFPNYEGCRHPSQLYESAKNLFIFFTLLFMYTKKKLKDGVIFWSFFVLYGVLRVITNIWREDSRILGISMGQFLSIIMIIIGIVFLIKILKFEVKK